MTLRQIGVKWAITADMDQAVRTVIASIPDEQWIELVKGCAYETAETIHTMNYTKKAFRLVIKRELRKQESLFEQGKYFHHAVATNWAEQEKDAKEALQWHNERGEAENFNKELKIGFAMERMPCGQTEANAIFFRIGVIAYNLFIGFKRLSCPDMVKTYNSDISLEDDTGGGSDSKTFRKHLLETGNDMRGGQPFS